MSITGCRNDALVGILNDLGYQPVLLPISGLKPPEVYVYREATGKLTRRGPLADYLKADAGIPKLSRGTLFDKLTHKETSRKNWKIAASFLGDALACIGITSAPKLDLSFVKNGEITFSFDDATFQGLDPSKIDHMLEDVRPGAIPQSDIEEGNLHIAYNYAYAGTLTMRVSGEFTASGSLKVLEIGKYIDLGADGKIETTNETTLTFTSTCNKSAVIAYQVGRLTKGPDRWEFHPGDTAGDNFLADSTAVSPYLMERGVVLRVETE
jgi:hypothetical protein